ncbi:hypothetical protein ACJRO7_010751 [Eucalyptus globulus]|uniref:Uncharacterized protein n=1 Tax=Eucalyptus globulus TaxID=34317 RepID=A0ABD3LCX7_EUCGL
MVVGAPAKGLGGWWTQLQQLVTGATAASLGWGASSEWRAGAETDSAEGCYRRRRSSQGLGWQQAAEIARSEQWAQAEDSGSRHGRATQVSALGQQERRIARPRGNGVRLQRG